MNRQQANNIATLAGIAFGTQGHTQLQFGWAAENGQMCYLAGVLKANDPNWAYRDPVYSLIQLGLSLPEISVIQQWNDADGLDWRQINTQVLRMATDEEDDVFSVEEVDGFFR